jgi:excisionase family DNA binding protein
MNLITIIALRQLGLLCTDESAWEGEHMKGKQPNVHRYANTMISRPESAEEPDPSGNYASHVRRLLPVKVAAERLGVSIWHVRVLAYRGRISSHKIGVRLMISEDEVNRIIVETERPRVVA